MSMDFPFLIGFCVFSTMIVIVGLFKRQEQLIKREFFVRTQSLIDAIACHRKQIAIRQKALDVYDFLKYNISDALLKQSKINLDA